MKKEIRFLLFLGALSVSAAAQADTGVLMNLVDENGVGKEIGQVTISETAYGLVFSPAVTGLPPGLHGFHVHENASCEPKEKDGKKMPALAAGGHYDVIVADNYHPARSGSGTLYTVEHFAALRERLGPGGVFCQWLPLHQLDLGTLRSIVRSFNAVFPRGWAMLATNSLETPVLGLIAHRDGERFDLAAVHTRLTTVRLPRAPEEFGIDDELALLGGFIAGPGALTRLAANAPLNTDDHPVVSYRAPRVTYAPDSTPRDRLFELLQAVDIAPDELLVGGNDSWQRRLAAYWSARDRYLAAGRDVRATPHLRDMLAQVEAPLLSVIRISPDFRPAYDPLVRMAAQLAGTDPNGARALLVQLADLQPARTEARDALRALTEPTPQTR